MSVHYGLSHFVRHVVFEPVWIRDIFNAKQAITGGIVRRSIRSVKRYASVAALKAAVQRRGFHMIISGRQFVVFCNDGSLKIST